MRSEVASFADVVRLADLVDDGVLVINDGYRAKNAELGSEGLPFVRAGNVRNGFDFADADILMPASVKKAGAKRSIPGDVVFTSKGTVGRFAFVSAATPEFVYSPQLCFWRVKDDRRLDPKFLFYWMQGPECGQQFNALKGQTDMADYISLRDQRSLLMTLPSVDEQKRIAAVLGALDDKIDSNRHVAVLLEETAGTLFRARFVDFIEVDQAEASRVGPVDEEFELLGGGTPKTSMSEYWDGGIPWIAVKDIGPGVFITQTEKSVTKLAVDQRWVRVYPAETAVISARGTVGSVGLMAAPMTVNQSCYAVRGRGGLGQIFVYFRLLEIVDRLRARSHGSVFPTITRDTFSAIMVTHPDASAHGQFERLTRPLFDQILALTRESATLTAIRDAVLPKLISGQIRVPDTTDSAEVIEPLAEQVAV